MNNNTNKTIEYLFKKVKSTRLNDHERATLQREIWAYMDAHPVLVPTRTPIRSPFFAHSTFMRAIPVVALVLIFSFGGLSYAAGNSLPGDTLFVFKTEVNERVEGLFVKSSKDRAQFEIKLVGRRLKEAETLAVKGELSGENLAIVEADLDKHVAEVSNHVDELTAKDDLFAAADVNNTLKASLEAHQETFSQIAISDGPSTEAALAPIISTLQGRVEATAKDKIDIEAKITTSISNESPTVEEQEKIDTDAGDVLIDTDDIDTEDLDPAGTATTTPTIPIKSTDIKTNTSVQVQGSTNATH